MTSAFCRGAQRLCIPIAAADRARTDDGRNCSVAAQGLQGRGKAEAKHARRACRRGETAAQVARLAQNLQKRRVSLAFFYAYWQAQARVKSGLRRIRVIITSGCPCFGNGVSADLTAHAQEFYGVTGQTQFFMSSFLVLSPMRIGGGSMCCVCAGAVRDERLFCVHCA